ncbi:RNA polymerase recycling motor HelD [Falsibacillus pallidus]|uniref:DNA helicase-2/ATP-dependent DNA helicase PcrA n=1 Tax=Falsibacillus pallidus TaxID=493781 RepID=A0A370H1N9_9BACI|nr:RNA polymerase recycling motor HelD [Falsibacillus pallidus]RDI47953.1 DNA helicase-2/ATP-dependent DNA helicase PcrA [Falsibacillus pallidus]
MTSNIPQHPDFTHELNRLDFTKKYIDVVIKTSSTSKDQFKSNIQEAFGDADWLDSSAAYTDILTNASFFEMSKEELESLELARTKPYFARIDFKGKDSGEEERHYIGKTSLYQRENQEQIIVDWRSPIANLYYEGRIGDVSYEAEGETYSGELTLKRQFMIEEGSLDEIRDIDLTTTDELLQESLAKSSSNRLTEIISTIQEEQNRIIRADLNKPIIVQGAAGSGKTTIALHRISYFIYNYKEYFDPRQLMILAPSRLFIDYISEALPELGVEKVRQTTFSDYVMTCIGRQLKLKEDDKLIKMVEEMDPESLKAAKLSGLKGSPVFQKILQGFLNEIYDRFHPKEDFIIDKYRLYSKKKFIKLLTDDFFYLPLYKRVEKLKSILQEQVRFNKKMMVDKVEKFFDEKIEKALYNLKDAAKRKDYVSRALDRKQERLKEIQTAIRQGVPSYMKQFEKKKLLDYYDELFSDPERLAHLSGGKLPLSEAEELCRYTMTHISKGKYELEDLGLLLYLQTELFGIEKHHRAKNVVIDEAQDYSYMQLASLKKALETDMFTLVGDLAQGIHSYRGILSWEQIQQGIFPRATYTELQKSYRTTIEIMNEANKLLSLLPYQFPEVTPVVRHGDKPAFFERGEGEELIAQLSGKIAESRKEKFHTFAIICKTMKDCLQLYDWYEKWSPDSAKLLKEQESIPKDKVVIVPAYLAKGLEFDVVIALSLNEIYKRENELDVKLLYVVMTRPLHRLFFYGRTEEDFLLSL